MPDAAGTALAQTYYRSTRDADLAEPIVLVAGQSLDGVEVRLVRQPVLTLRGRVFHADGSLAAQALIRIAWRLLTAIRYMNGRTDADGRFALPRLFAGDYMLTAGAGSPVDELAIRPVVLESDTSVDVRLARGGVVEGEVQWAGDEHRRLASVAQTLRVDSSRPIVSGPC